MQMGKNHHLLKSYMMTKATALVGILGMSYGLIYAQQRHTSNDPTRTDMHQSYSTSYISKYQGEPHIHSVYLNYLSFEMSESLLLFTEFGFYTPFHVNLNSSSNSYLHRVQDPRQQSFEHESSLIIPQLGLEYQPNEHLTMVLSFVKSLDFYQAHGGISTYPYHAPAWQNNSHSASFYKRDKN